MSVVSEKLKGKKITHLYLHGRTLCTSKWYLIEHTHVRTTAEEEFSDVKGGHSMEGRVSVLNIGLGNSLYSHRGRV